jgi:hypothetical protein
VNCRWEENLIDNMTEEITILFDDSKEKKGNTFPLRASKGRK